MQWIYLIIAGLFEVVWATALKYSNGFTLLIPSVITAVGMAVSVFFLALAMKTMPLGTAYTIWTGIGAVGSFILGIILFHESASFWRIVAVGLILAGLIILKDAH